MEKIRIHIRNKWKHPYILRLVPSTLFPYKSVVGKCARTLILLHGNIAQPGLDAIKTWKNIWSKQLIATDFPMFRCFANKVYRVSHTVTKILLMCIHIHLKSAFSRFLRLVFECVHRLWFRCLIAIYCIEKCAPELVCSIVCICAFTALTSQFRSEYNGLLYESNRNGNKKWALFRAKSKCVQQILKNWMIHTYIVWARIQIALLLIDTPLFGHLYVLQSFQNSYNAIIDVSSDVYSAPFMASAKNVFSMPFSSIHMKCIAGKLLNM